MDEITLYCLNNCPFCQKVFRFMEAKGIEIDVKDVSTDEAARDRLINEGGKYQVPCLFIDNRPLYESDEIIAWFEDKLLIPEINSKLKGIGK